MALTQTIALLGLVLKDDNLLALAVFHHEMCIRDRDEIVPVVIHNKKKGDIVIDTDEHPIRNCSYETISKMKAVFTPDGVKMCIRDSDPALPSPPSGRPSSWARVLTPAVTWSVR